MVDCYEHVHRTYLAHINGEFLDQRSNSDILMRELFGDSVFFFFFFFFFFFLFFFFIRHCNPCGFWPAQLALSILSRKVFTECRCQRHVKPPNLEDQWFRTFQLQPPGVHHVWNDASEPSSGRWNYGREMVENFAESGDFHVTFGFFYIP